MNILIYNAKKNWGGITTEDELIIKGFRDRKHNVIVVARPGAKFASNSVYKDEFITFSIGTDFNPISIIRLIRIIEKNRIDVVLTNMNKEVTIAGTASRLCGIPNIRRTGSADDLGDERRYFTITERFLITHNLMPCNFVFDSAYKTNKKIDRRNYSTVYTGKDIIPYTSDEINELKQSWGIKDNEIVLGITCQLVKVKAIPDLINVFERLSKTHYNLRLVITGAGSEKDNLIQLVNELKLQDKVYFAGFTKQPQLTASAYDVCLHTSHSEGMPNVIYEYMTANKPIICSDVGGIKEILTHGESCLLYPPGDLETLYKHLETVLSQPDLAHNLSENAFNTIKQYDTSRFITQLECIFSHYINKKKRKI